jgi:hypothetical protein
MAGSLVVGAALRAAQHLCGRRGETARRFLLCLCPAWLNAVSGL